VLSIAKRLKKLCNHNCCCGLVHVGIKINITKNEQRYDLILDVAAHHSIFDYKRALSPKGIYVLVGGSTARMFQVMFLGPLISMTGSKKMGILMHKPNKDLAFIKELFEAGKVAPVIDRRYPLSEVAEALRYFGEGHARGKVVIAVEHNGKTYQSAAPDRYSAALHPRQ